MPTNPEVTLPPTTIKPQPANTLAGVFQRLLEKSTMSMAELARASGLTHDAVSHYMAGRREPSLTSVRKLCRGFRITLAKLEALLPPLPEDGK